jgi:hypothetical protein
MDDNVEAVSRLVAIEGDYHGHAGLRRWWDNLFEILPDITIEIVDVRDLGHLTLAVGRLYGRGADSAGPFEEKVWQLVDWRDRRIVWWATYVTEAEALEAVGLRH